ncbi:hypothetical protein DB29_01634 [Shouchella clausii]|nr:hypothetical protein DB29_01634 [Shouchella clausii]
MVFGFSLKNGCRLYSVYRFFHQVNIEQQKKTALQGKPS